MRHVRLDGCSLRFLQRCAVYSPQESMSSMRLHRTVTPKSRLRRSAASILSVGAGLLLAAGGVSGCSVLYDLSTEQCKSTADCVALGGAFATLECRDDLCQEPLGCQSNAECMDQNGDG